MSRALRSAVSVPTRPARTRTRGVRAALLYALCALSTFATANAAGERFDCLVEPMIVTDVGSPVQGVIREVKVHRGAHVRRGDPLVYLDAEAEAMSYELAAARAGMSSEIAARRAELSLAELNLARAKSLQADEMLAGKSLDEAVANHSLAVAALRQASDNRRLMEIELDRARMQMERRVVRSPLAGVIVEQQAFEGEFVYDNPVMTVAQLDPLRIEVVLPGSRHRSVAPGDAARVHLELGDEVLTATVERKDPFLDPRSGTFNVLLLLPNADLSVVSGQDCAIEFLDTARATDEYAAGDTDP